MDAFDYAESKKARLPQDKPGRVWNFLTLIMLGGAALVAGIFLLIFLNPYMGLNPFPPPTKILLLDPSVTPTTILDVLPPTWTPEPTAEPTLTATLRPSSTPWPSPTVFGLPTLTPTAGPSPTPGGLSFDVLQGSPMASPNIFHMDRGCNWMGVYGQVRDLSGHPIPQQIVQLGGTLDGQRVELTTVTGLVSYNGEFGFEFELSDHPIQSTQTLWVQLLDISLKIPLSEKIYIDTYESCDQNMIVIYFTQVK